MGSLVTVLKGGSVLVPGSAVSLLVAWGQVSPSSLRSLSDHRGQGVTSNRLALPLCWMSQTWKGCLEQAGPRAGALHKYGPHFGPLPTLSIPGGLGLKE